jgi:hypothetical protein
MLDKGEEKLQYFREFYEFLGACESMDVTLSKETIDQALMHSWCGGVCQMQDEDIDVTSRAKPVAKGKWGRPRKAVSNEPSALQMGVRDGEALAGDKVREVQPAQVSAEVGEV